MTRPVRRLAALAAAIALVATGCAENAPQDYLEPEGPIARQLDNLWRPTFWIATFVFVLVEGLVIFIIFRFRERGEGDAPVQVHGNTKLEITWTIIPAAILAFLGALTVVTIADLAEDPQNALEVRVTGHRFWWEYEYPEFEIVTANELHVPVGTPVHLTMTSADVIHSFWPPKLAGKQDVVPGRESELKFTAERAGTYLGQCTEFCGASHANMRLTVVAHDPDEFEEWVDGQQEDAPAPDEDDAEVTAGAQLFAVRGCAGCHTIQGVQGAVGTVGPDLTHLMSRDTFAGAMFELNDKNLRRWLRNPPEEKPGSQMPDLGLTEEEITQLIAYLKTLE